MPELSRRTALQLLGVGAAAAACSRSESGADSENEFHAAYPYDAPPKGHYNFLGGVEGQITMGYIFDLFMVPGATYLWHDQKYYYLLADPTSALSPDGKTFTYKVKSGLKWSDGSPITARDVYTMWLLRWANKHSIVDYIDGIELVDDSTVRFTITTPAPITEYYLLRERPVPEAEFGKWAKRVESLLADGATPDDQAVVKIVEEVNAFKPKAPLVSGPFIIDYDMVANGQLSLSKNPRGYGAKSIAFDRIRVFNGVTVTDVLPMLLDNQVDYATYGFPVAAEQRIAKAGYRIVRPPRYDGYGVYFNFGKLPEFRDKRVRQALAHAINREKSAAVAMGESSKACEYMAGFADILVPQWISAAEQERLERYPYDPSLAEEGLEAAGWRRDGDGWITTAGNRAAYEVLFASGYAEGQSTAQSVEEHFGAIGIKIRQRGIDPAQMWDETAGGKFELAADGWGDSGSPFPAGAFRGMLLDRNYAGLAPDRGIDFPLTQDTEVVGRVDLEELVIDSGLGASTDALKHNITTVALAFNELLPMIPMWGQFGNNPVLESRVTGWPDDSDPIYLNSPYADNFTPILLYQGKLRPA